nr:unnamed protein product [Digitaria exilis]
MGGWVVYSTTHPGLLLSQTKSQKPHPSPWRWCVPCSSPPPGIEPPPCSPLPTPPPPLRRPRRPVGTLPIRALAFPAQHLRIRIHAGAAFVTTAAGKDGTSSDGAEELKAFIAKELSKHALKNSRVLEKLFDHDRQILATIIIAVVMEAIGIAMSKKSETEKGVEACCSGGGGGAKVSRSGAKVAGAVEVEAAGSSVDKERSGTGAKEVPAIGSGAEKNTGVTKDPAATSVIINFITITINNGSLYAVSRLKPAYWLVSCAPTFLQGPETQTRQHGHQAHFQ